MKPGVYLLSAKQGGGKTTVAAALAKTISETRPECVVFTEKFANPLYDLQNLIIEHIFQISGIRLVNKQGELLQYLGTDFIRKVLGEDFLVQQAKVRIAQKAAEFDGTGLTPCFVIDDCRFPNELSAFDWAEVVKVRLICPEDVRKARTPVWRDNTNHASETALDFLDDYLGPRPERFIPQTPLDGPPESYSALERRQHTWVQKARALNGVLQCHTDKVSVEDCAKHILKDRSL